MNRRLKIAHITKTYLPDTCGGVEQTIFQICRQSAAAGHENRVITLSHHPMPREIQRPEALVVRYPVSFGAFSVPVSVSLFRDFRRLIADVDILHYHAIWPFADLCHLSSRNLKPAVVTYHSDMVRFVQRCLNTFYRPLMRRFFNQVRHILVTSPQYLESSKDLAPFRSKCSVIPLGLEKKSYPPVGIKPLQRWQARFGEEFFLFVGVLRYYKGLHILLEAVAGTQLKVVIAGTGPLHRKLQAQVRKLDLQGQVHFAGFVSERDKVALLSLCRALVLPSHLRSEAFGIALLEGAMFGRPLISAELGTGSSFVNKEGLTGMIVPPADPQALRSAMQTLALDDRMCATMGRAARSRFETLFAADHMGEAYLQVYNELANPRDLTVDYPEQHISTAAIV